MRIPELLGFVYHLATCVLIFSRAIEGDVSDGAALIFRDLPYRHLWRGVDSDISKLVDSVKSLMFCLDNGLQVWISTQIKFISEARSCKFRYKILQEGLASHISFHLG